MRPTRRFVTATAGRWTASTVTTPSAHPIAASAELAVDRAIAAGPGEPAAPDVRRESVRLLKASYPSSGRRPTEQIGQGLRTLYAARNAAGDQQALERTVTALQGLYRRSVFPTMKVSWGTYPDNRGHTTSNGCFRCHDDSHKASRWTRPSAATASTATRKSRTRPDPGSGIPDDLHPGGGARTAPPARRRQTAAEIQRFRGRRARGVRGTCLAFQSVARPGRRGRRVA